MKCPMCKKEVAFGDLHMPFCSERCKIIDLGNWAAEKYTIPAPIEPGFEPEEGEEKGDAK